MRALNARLRPRRPGFVLTPLIDVIFLLLVFFMLSSRIAPFGLLPVTGGAAAAPDGPATSVAEAGPAPVLLRVSRGHVSAGDRTIALAELPAAIEAMRGAGVKAVVVTTTLSATVQDVVSALQAFRVSRFERVTLVAGPAGR
jgi:biopolymer transport protein ExbD